MSSVSKWPHQNTHIKGSGPYSGGSEKRFQVGNSWPKASRLLFPPDRHIPAECTRASWASTWGNTNSDPITVFRLLTGFHLRNNCSVFNINHIWKKYTPKQHIAAFPNRVLWPRDSQCISGCRSWGSHIFPFSDRYWWSLSPRYSRDYIRGRQLLSWLPPGLSCIQGALSRGWGVVPLPLLHPATSEMTCPSCLLASKF